jgi:ribosomal protein L34E
MSDYPTRERTQNITRNFAFADGDSWNAVRGNYIEGHPKTQQMRENIRQNGINKPIPIDYEQDPPKVLDGHTRLFHADALGMTHVPVRHVTEDDHRWEETSPEDGHHVAPREHVDRSAQYRGWAEEGAREKGHTLGEFQPHPKMDTIQIAQCRGCGAKAMYTGAGQVRGDALENHCSRGKQASRPFGGRNCDKCGARSSPHIPRQRVGSELWCGMCAQNQERNMTTARIAISLNDDRIVRVAHDSGDGETLFHCPFDGSGQIIARSDGTVECEFCNAAFTVQVQPTMPAFPQTVNGVPVDVPGMPNGGKDANVPPGAAGGAGAPLGPDGAPVDDPAAGGDVDAGDDAPVDDEDDDKPAFLKGGLLYRTASGRGLTEEQYMRHLAIVCRTDDAVLDQVRTMNQRQYPSGARTALEVKMASDDEDYRMQHRPGGPEFGAPLHDLNDEEHGIFPHDVYKNPHYYTADYGTGRRGDPEMLRQMQQARGKPDHPVTIYRALPHGHNTIRTGDWVTTSAEYAKSHAAQENPEDDWPVIKATVPAKHVWNNGDDLIEQGYHGPHVQAEIHSPGGRRHARRLAAQKEFA